MYTAGNFAFREVGLELLREQAFAADRGQRLVETFVARCFVGLELGSDAPLFQQVLYLPRLFERQRRRSRRDDQRIRHAASTKPSMVDRAASAFTSNPR